MLKPVCANIALLFEIAGTAKSEPEVPSDSREDGSSLQLQPEDTCVQCWRCRFPQNPANRSHEFRSTTPSMHRCRGEGKGSESLSTQVKPKSSGVSKISRDIHQDSVLFTATFTTIPIPRTILAWADQSWNARSKCRRTRVWAAMVYGMADRT